MQHSSHGLDTDMMNLQPKETKLNRYKDTITQYWGKAQEVQLIWNQSRGSADKSSCNN